MSTSQQGRVVTSRNDPAVRQVRSLQRREERDRSGRFYTEGIRFVAQAAEAGAPIELLVVAPELLTNAFGRRLVRRLRQEGVAALEVSAEVFRSLGLAEEPQGVGAVLRQRWMPLSFIHPSEGLCWVAVSTVRSPGNLGSMIRTGDAVGAAGVLFIGEGPDPYDPATVRASMGALFSQRFVRTTLPELAAWKERHGCLLVGTSPAAREDYHQIRYPPPTVLFMGGERKGLSPEEQALCDRMVRIPMVGRSDSLNLAVAASLMLYEVFNQRRAHPASF